MANFLNDSDFLEFPKLVPSRPKKQKQRENQKLKIGKVKTKETIQPLIFSKMPADQSNNLIISGDSLLPATDSIPENHHFPSCSPAQKSQNDQHQCPICDKNLEHLNETRRLQHVNDCLDGKTSERKAERSKNDWIETVDCPLCRRPLPAGPNRAAHAKRCGRLHNISPAQLLQLMNTQTDVANARKEMGLAHTSAVEPNLQPVQKKQRNDLLPRNFMDEQVEFAKALSSSLSSPRKEKDKQRSRKISTEEDDLPLECRCKVIDKLHERFLERFSAKKNCNNNNNNNNINDEEEVLKSDTKIEDGSERLDITNTLSNFEQKVISKKNSETKESSQTCVVSSRLSVCKMTPPAAVLRRHKSQPLLGSNVKIVKKDQITPMPDFTSMNTPRIKAELSKFGIRPLGKRKAIALLKDIYEETHPVVEFDTEAKSVANFDSDPTDEGDEGTLNSSFESELAEESLLDENEAGNDHCQDAKSMHDALLKWFRSEENHDLLVHVLALKPIAFDEIHGRLLKSNSVVSTVSKNLLMDFLDQQHVTFSLPADGWKSKRRIRKLALSKKKT